MKRFTLSPRAQADIEEFGTIQSITGTPTRPRSTFAKLRRRSKPSPMILALANRVTRCAPVTENILPARISSFTERRRMELILCAFCINAWTSSVIYKETLSLSVVSRMMTSFIIQESDVAAIF